MTEKYESPLSSRYASAYMLNLFSMEKRIQTWRRLWVALARAEHRLGLNVTNGLHVNEKIVEKTVREYLPFIATENLMMEGVKRGGNRQELHEVIRSASMDATAKMKEGQPWDLLADLAKHPEFGMTKEEMEAVLDPKLYTGRCAEQVERFVEQVKPLIQNVGADQAEINL